MQGSNLPMRKWAIAIYLVTTNLKGVSSMKLHRDLEHCKQESAWFMAHRIRETWERRRPHPFCGPTEVDETYIGGKERNKHSEYKKQRRAGRGPVGKVAVVGAKDRETEPRLPPGPSPSRRRQDAAGIRPGVHRGRLRGLHRRGAAYEGMPHRSHWAVKHSAGEYVKRQASTNGIESFLGVDEAWTTTGRLSPCLGTKHLGRYVDEFQGGTTTRPLDTASTRWVEWQRGSSESGSPMPTTDRPEGHQTTEDVLSSLSRF